MFRRLGIVGCAFAGLLYAIGMVHGATWQFTSPPNGTKCSKTANISCGGMVSGNNLAFILEAFHDSVMEQSSSGTSSASMSWSSTLNAPTDNWPTGDLVRKLTAFESGAAYNPDDHQEVEIVSW